MWIQRRGDENLEALRRDLLSALDNNPDVWELGFRFAYFDRRLYFLWIIDCARHVLPIAERYLTNEQVAQLSSALDVAVDFVDGKRDEAAVLNAAALPRQISNGYRDANGEIGPDLSDTLDVISKAIELTQIVTSTHVYHGKSWELDQQLPSSLALYAQSQFPQTFAAIL